jgi:hypothetical protein
MADTIYTPSEMLDRVEARVSVLRRDLEELDLLIDAAQYNGERALRRKFQAEREKCVADIALLFQNVI